MLKTELSETLRNRDVRTGDTARAASCEEGLWRYRSSAKMRYDLKAVPGSSLADLDLRRLRNYFRDVRQQECPDGEDEEAWSLLLFNTGFMLQQADRAVPNTGSILLFGRRPNRFLPQAGITAVAYFGVEKEYAARERALLRGPIAPLLSSAGEVQESGLIEQAMEFVRRNTVAEAWIDEGGRRQERWTYPMEAVREAVVNAVAHRDYTITVTDIELSLYEDRLEVVSPGSLPNTVTVEKVRHGCRVTRNELIKEVLRDYCYIESTGMGVPRKIIRGMREHNGIEPDLVEEEHRFTVRLRR